MKQNEIQLGEYIHFKGGHYEVIGVAKHSETLEELVVYRGLYGDGALWIRPVASFKEMVVVEGVTKARFIFIKNPNTNERK